VVIAVVGIQKWATGTSICKSQEPGRTREPVSGKKPEDRKLGNQEGAVDHLWYRKFATKELDRKWRQKNAPLGIFVLFVLFVANNASATKSTKDTKKTRRGGFRISK
jgi:hypothetical protein